VCPVLHFGVVTHEQRELETVIANLGRGPWCADGLAGDGAWWQEWPSTRGPGSIADLHPEPSVFCRFSAKLGTAGPGEGLGSIWADFRHRMLIIRS
jgi:hypothetical protein